MFLLVLFACIEAEEATYTQYNGDGDALAVEVGVETRFTGTEDAGDLAVETVSTALTSSTGAIEVGAATASPSAGPVGTIHTMTVEILADYASDVDKVTLLTDSGDRGADEYDLERDSAGEGVWVLELKSVGEPGETRTDTVTFRLYQEDSTEE